MDTLKFDQYIKLQEKIDTDVLRFGLWLRMNEQNNTTSSSDPIRSAAIALSNAEALAKSEKIMQLAKLKIVKHFEWFKPYLNIMPPVPVFGAGSKSQDGIGTMSTSGSAIYYDPRFVIISYEEGKRNFASEITDDQKKRGALAATIKGTRWYSDYATFVIIHEILHNSLKHFSRTRKDIQSDYLSQQQIFTLWNLAQDYEINRILRAETKIVLMPGGVDLYEGHFKVPAEDVEFFENSTSDRIFWKLFRDMENQIREERGEEEEEEETGDDEGSEDNGDEGSEDNGDDGDNGDEGSEDNGDEGSEDNGDDGDNGDEDRPLKSGDIIKDNDTGEYGRVTNVAGDDVQWDPISDSEARIELYGESNWLNNI